MKARSGKRIEPSQLANGLGARLRSFRETAAISVRELARRIDVSPSLISQVEHGKVVPSVDTLYRVANELGLSVGDFFGDEGPGRAAGAGNRAARISEVVQPDTRKKVQLAGGIIWERLTADPNDKVEFLHVTYQVGSESCPQDSLIRHGGKEYACVLSGRLGLRIGFEEHELGPGDSIAFDAQMPHRLWTIGNRPATAIWVILNREGDTRKWQE